MHHGFHQSCFCLDRYRGQMQRDNGRLGKVITIIWCITIHAIRASPLRTHETILDAAALASVGEKAAEIDAAEAVRSFFDGLPLGRVRDLRTLPGDLIGGPIELEEDGEEPTGWEIDTGRRAQEFRRGSSLLSILIASESSLFRRTRARMVVGLVVAR